MHETQYYVLVTIPLVGILMNGGLFVYLAGRMDTLTKEVHSLVTRITVVEDRAR